MTPSRLRASLILGIMPLLFASNLVIGRAAVETVPPFTLAFMRWSLAALILLPFARNGVRRNAQAIRAEWPRFAILGFLGMWICGGVVYVSLKYTTATHATLIYTSSPVMVVLLAAILARRPLPLSQMAGIPMAVTGVALTASQGNLAGILQLDLNAGDLGIFVCAISWATYSLVLKRRAFEAIPTTASFFVIAACGAALLLPAMLYELATIGGFPMTARAWTSIAGLVFFSSVFSYSSYQYGIRNVGPSVTSVFMYLSPAYGIFIAVLFLGEQFRLYHAVSLVLLIGGVVLATGPQLLAGFARKRQSAA